MMTQDRQEPTHSTVRARPGMHEHTDVPGQTMDMVILQLKKSDSRDATTTGHTLLMMGSITVYSAPLMHDLAAIYWTVSCSRFHVHSSDTYITTHMLAPCIRRGRARGSKLALIVTPTVHLLVCGGVPLGWQ
eukprot:6871719-Prymnesium_polylepis.1